MAVMAILVRRAFRIETSSNKERSKTNMIFRFLCHSICASQMADHKIPKNVQPNAKITPSEHFPSTQWTTTQFMIREACRHYAYRIGSNHTLVWGTEKEGHCIVTVDTSKSSQPGHMRRDLLFIESACPFDINGHRHAGQPYACVHDGLHPPIKFETFHGLMGAIRAILVKM